MKEKWRVEGKKIVITGASRGIGRAIVEELALNGAELMFTSRNQKNADRTAEEIKKKHTKNINSAKLHAAVCDVKDYTSVQALMAEAIHKMGGIDVWINNAGVSEPFNKIIDQSPQEWYEPIEVNLKGSFHSCKAVIPFFLKQGHGKIINMAGSGANNEKRNTACLSGYACSKAAIRRLTDTLAEEYQGRNIEFMLLNPGMVRTEILGTAHPTPELAKRLDRFLTVQDIFAQHPSVAAKAALKLCSDWSNGKNGHYETVFSKWKARQLLLTYPFRKWRGTIDRTIY
ncbi:MAG: SDR family oxidoreductase [Chloroherpetonaceae bacterium]|nr:SDR family oxidoreductase [Chloroherpetonaceae bacterium]